MAVANSSFTEKMLSKFPIEARIHTRNVSALGMSVFLEASGNDEYLCWQGSDEQFTRSAVFEGGLDFGKIKREKRLCPWGLRGYLRRLENGELKYMIAWCHLPSRPINYMRIAKTDEAFIRFKGRCFQPVETNYPNQT